MAQAGEVVRQMYINGKWVEAKSGKNFKVINPATGETVAEVPDGGAEDARLAIKAAHEAFKSWSRVSPVERSRSLEKAFKLMTERRDELAKLITLENGKPFEEAKKEVGFGAGYFDWFAGEARRVYGEVIPSPAGSRRFWMIRQPVGVVAAITPWNFPATMITRKIAPALAAGCTVVLKPAEQTPLTALGITKILHDVGLPPGVLNVVTALNPEPIGKEFLTNPLVRKIAFTGSTEVGKLLMRGAADQLKRVSFELGGNAPFIVFEDADFDAAVDGAVGMKYLRVAGQSCICANRIYVQESIADRFTKAYVEKVKGIKVGHGFEPGVVIGPLINKDTLEKVDRLVRDAVKKGAKVATGGGRLKEAAFTKGYFYAPTVLTNVTEEMGVTREEIFGPVAPILTFRTEGEVIERANNTNYGLASYVFTKDLGRVFRIAEALEYGLVGVNDAAGYGHETPFGGFKESGLGREGGKEGIEEYTEAKSIIVNVPQ
ncbi:MAG: NAD-dependent succinate-semialdehyde dehydrogenase [Candidatus Methylomirabilales bacterium]